jgi:hypothetical protein
MKAPLSLFAVFFCLSTVCFSQYQLIALEKTQEIRLLQTDRETVRGLLRDFSKERSSDTSDDFSTADASIEVFYSSGTCDDDEDEIWDVPAGRVIRIEIVPNHSMNVVGLSIDLSKLYREQIYFDDPEDLIFHDKKRGFAVVVNADEIERFILIPPASAKARRCKTKKAKEFISGKSWFGDTKLEDRRSVVCGNFHANVTDMEISSENLTGLSSKEINVTVTAVDPENDVLTYNYSVSAGRIIGNGAKVIWDLKGVSPGTYSITVGVDDGAGIVGMTKTKAIIIN